MLLKPWSKEPPFDCRTKTGDFCTALRVRLYCSCSTKEENQPVLIIVGGGAAGIFGAIRAKLRCPRLEVVVLEKRQFLSKVKISGGGRCNVTTNLYHDPLVLSEQYPRGHKELRGSFFHMHGPKDTANWFLNHGIPLKTEKDGRMFPESDSSETIVDCLLAEANRLGVTLHSGVQVVRVLRGLTGSLFEVQVRGNDHRVIPSVAHFLIVSTGGSRQGYSLVQQLGHSIIDPCSSLFTFKVADCELHKLSGVSFVEVHAQLEIAGHKCKFNQFGAMLVTHWGLSGPAVLRLSAWAARDLFSADYQGILRVDFVPKMSFQDVCDALKKHRKYATKRQLSSYAPNQFLMAQRFWEYLLSRVDIDKMTTWATLSNSSIQTLAAMIKNCTFSVCGKGEFKEEFVTAGGVPLVEVNFKTMESQLCPRLYLAGEILNVDGITGGFNFQNAWTGGYIAGTNIAAEAGKLLDKGC